VKLELRPYTGWHATTGLEGSGRHFTAPNYDHFVDCPIEIGKQKDFAFEVDGVPHVLSIAGEGNWNSDTLIRDISRIVKIEKDLFGRFPYRRYVFLLHCDPSGGGGTEHLNSTIMGTRPFVFKNPESYRSFLGLVSHEFFHTWNVKQFRPKGLSPYDYTRENYSRELWIAEGTTSYYDELLLVRAGFLPKEKYLENIAGAVARDRQRPGNAVQPLAEASFDAWVKYWRGTEQSYNAEADYYGKGAVVSFLLDFEIRRRSANAASLDDVMRSMFKNFPPSGPGYTVEDFRTAAEASAGGSLEQFFRDYVFGTAPLPWDSSLAVAGLLLTPKDTTRRPWIGITTSNAGDRTRISGVTAGSPAEAAGIEVGDELLALDGMRVRSAELIDRLGDYAVGATAVLTVFRNDRLREYRVTVGSSPVPSYALARAASPSELQQAIYRSWLGER
jgi:predicted metalloprotease with PDZ domain